MNKLMRKPFLDPNNESSKNKRAFECWINLGPKRTNREVGRRMEISPNTVGRWKKAFNWQERLNERSTILVEKKNAGALVDPEDPIGQKLNDMMDRVEALIGSAFQKQPDGSLISLVTFKDSKDLTALIGEYRKYLETYHKFVAVHMPDKKEKKKNVNIKEMIVNIGDIPQKKRTKFLKDMKDGNVTGGNIGSEADIQEASFEQIFGSGDENGSGCDGVPGSPADSDSGNEEDLPSA